MTAALRDAALHEFCDVLDAVPPSAPTLCEGWDAHDLAVHVWTLSHDPISWVGTLGGPIGALVAPRSERFKRARRYPELVSALRQESSVITCMMPADRLEDYRHAIGEYYVHTQDVARANDLHRPAPTTALQEALWRRARVAAMALHVTHFGLVLEHADGRRARITPGRPRTVVRGLPSEVLLWVHGRRSVADVEVLHP